MLGLYPTPWRWAYLAGFRGKNLQPPFLDPILNGQNPLRRAHLFGGSVTYCLTMFYRRTKNLQPPLRNITFVTLCCPCYYGIFLPFFCVFDRFPLTTIKYALDFKDRESTSCRQHNVYSKVSRIKLSKIGGG